MDNTEKGTLGKIKNSDSEKPFKRKVLKSETTTISQPIKLETIINNGLAIIGSELANYRAKVDRGVMLSTREARIVQVYVDSLLKAARESREQARAEDLSNLSNEELLDLANQLLKAPKRVDLSDPKPDE